MDKDADSTIIKVIYYKINLFISGNDTNSVNARLVINRLCERYIKGHYELYIIDVLKDYQAAISNKIIVVPTLIIEGPTRKTVIVGSLRDEEKVINAFEFDNRDVRP